MTNSLRIHRAGENNLRDVSLELPLYRLSAITGVSGSGKSSLLKNVMAAYGAEQYIRFSSKTVRDTLRISRHIKVSGIENLPMTIFIDASNSVSVPSSTVSTISGIHEILRNIYSGFADTICPACGAEVCADVSSLQKFEADLINGPWLTEAIEFINTHGKLIDARYYDKKGKYLKKPTRAAAFATLQFSLNKVTDRLLHFFNHEFHCRLRTAEGYDPSLFCKCSCGQLLPRLRRGRFSFNTPYDEGGGGCSCCGGSGICTQLNESALIADTGKNIWEGAWRFVTPKGVTYTNVSADTLRLFARKHHIDLSKPLSELKEEEIRLLLWGDGEPLAFSASRPDKTISFTGIGGALKANLSKKGMEDKLAGLFVCEECPVCRGTRIDPRVNCFVVSGKTLSELLVMSLDELIDHVRALDCGHGTELYWERILRKLEYFRETACSHLSLNRASRTLSGGELQRIRLCSLLNSGLTGICYLLDEPSTGLHGCDLQHLGRALQSLCSQGNTVVMVEHNPQLLRYSHHIADFGVEGGKGGGELIFSAPVSQINGYDSPTALLLSNAKAPAPLPQPVACSYDWIHIPPVTFNNLKDIAVSLPRGKFTTVCGISGSGKSTFVRKGVYSAVSLSPEKYGFEGISYLWQDAAQASGASTVGTLMGLAAELAKRFARLSKLPQGCFLLNSPQGKCPTCSGRGYILSEDNTSLGTCDECQGRRFAPEVLVPRLQGLSIDECLALPLSNLMDVLAEPKFKALSEVTKLLGIDYLALDRPSRSLSKGELQRLKLAKVIYEQRSNHLYLLDEPSKGLHQSDAEKLARAIHAVTQAGNTVIAVEHNLEVIRNSDFVIEFGGTGKDGGNLLYCGAPSIEWMTPTSELMAQKADFGNDCPDRTARCYTIRKSGAEISLRRNGIHRLSEGQETVHSAADLSQNEYLAAAIPNNIFFSRSRDDDTEIFLPLMFKLDFNEKKRYDINLCHAMGFQAYIDEELRLRYPEKADFLKNVFTPESSTGKCRLCKGCGTVESVDEHYFLENAALSRACKRFLQEVADFRELAAHLKKTRGISLTNMLSGPDSLSWKVLFYGTEFLDRKDAPGPWEGLIAYFLRNHKYYKTPEADKVYAAKVQVGCPICNGRMLQEMFLAYRLWGLDYAGLLTHPLQQLAERLAPPSGDTPSRFCKAVCLLCKAGLGHLTLSSSLASLPARDVALIRLVSHYSSAIRDTGIVLSNIDAGIADFVNELVSSWEEANTIIFV